MIQKGVTRMYIPPFACGIIVGVVGTVVGMVALALYCHHRQKAGKK